MNDHYHANFCSDTVHGASDDGFPLLDTLAREHRVQPAISFNFIICGGDILAALPDFPHALVLHRQKRFIWASELRLVCTAVFTKIF
jgi:hypothetical protein